MQGQTTPFNITFSSARKVLAWKWANLHEPKNQIELHKMELCRSDHGVAGFRSAYVKGAWTSLGLVWKVSGIYVNVGKSQRLCKWLLATPLFWHCGCLLPTSLKAASRLPRARWKTDMLTVAVSVGHSKLLPCYLPFPLPQGTHTFTWG